MQLVVFTRDLKKKNTRLNGRNENSQPCLELTVTIHHIFSQATLLAYNMLTFVLYLQCVHLILRFISFQLKLFET